ncbi:hypothetical protein Taro_018239 [Colocasia esculenta]|uniref:Uncharacterized protein n=1 Tax=Colocasia esculenta TaxID=4460 RepID=A0A843UQW2_COLES|nr:hypothetical protein [Colocasia esculenta]
MTRSTNFLCKRCVDTPINGVDTSSQTQREIVQKCQECVDTCQECVDTSGSFPEIKGTQVDTLPGQVDTRPSSQNSQFEELGQQVDTLKSRSTRDPSPRTDFSIFGTKPLKHLKEADQVEAIVGEEFKEGPTSQTAEHRLGLHVYKLLPNSSFYKGVHLKNEAIQYILLYFCSSEISLEIMQIACKTMYQNKIKKIKNSTKSKCLSIAPEKPVDNPAQTE